VDNERVIVQFHQQIESEITESTRQEGGFGSGEFRENVLTSIYAEELSAAGVLESPEVCHLEGGKGNASIKVNGYGVPEEDSRIDLFITLHYGPSDEIVTINAAEVETAFKKLERFFGKSLDGLYKELDPAGDQYLMAEHIQGLKAKMDRVCFYLFTNARLAQRKEKEHKSDIFGLEAVYEVWDLERFRRLRESGTSYEALVVNLEDQKLGGLPCVLLGTNGGNSQTCVTLFPGELLCELYDEYGPRLLELNVRSYLQARGKVNKGIMETLQKSPQDFLAYNNGITVVAEEIIFGKLSNGSLGILELRGMQIVNGGQTTASIHRAAKDFGADLSCVSVQGKVTVVDGARFQDIVPLISRFSNTQNRVTEADLSANHPFHIGMERVSRREWTPDQRSMWFYERARGSYQTAKIREGNTPSKRKAFEDRYPSNQRFSKEDLARFENTWLGLPHIVSRGSQKNFVHFMHELGQYDEGWEPDMDQYRQYVAKGLLFKEAQRVIRADRRITAYQINVAAYTVALLAEKTARRLDLKRIWRMQKVSEATSELLAAWVPIVFKHLPDYAAKVGKHIGESFKASACWDNIRGLDLVVPKTIDKELVDVPAGEDELSAARRRDSRKLSSNDKNNIARCMELGQKEWLAIALWGQKTNILADWQRGIARTLSGYAAEKWVKRPSSKQAYHGVHMIESARTAGIL